MTTTIKPSWRRRVAVLVAGVLSLSLSACSEGAMGAASGVRRWVGPQVSVPGGGQFRTNIFYGPWQCSAQLWNYCRDKCSGDGYALQGCVWLADVKMDFDGNMFRAGSRFGIANCCCNYPTLSVSQNATARSRWESIREDFRERWAEKFGAWPTAANGDNYPAHHIRDLKHGGNPTDWDNLIPYPADLHSGLNQVYNQCYAGQPPWTSVGGNYPYGE